jgi:RimJ/RimL family protein N-acetyltransferase
MTVSRLMQPLPTLQGRRVVLSPLRDEDADVLFRWINDRALVEFSAPFREVAWEDHRRWLDAVRAAEDVAAFGIREPSDGRLVGSCQLVNIDRDARTAELRIRLGDASARDGGRGTEATVLLTRFGHDELGLDRIWLEVFATNLRALRAYEKAGFVRERADRLPAMIGGEPREIIVMARHRG